MTILAGTSGYSYKEWVGPFYPDKTKSTQMLERYAAVLPTVEINNTFYRMPKSSVLETWADQVPDSFRFSIKASRRITHFKRLANVDEELDYLLRALESLGEKLGVILFQLPPQLRKDVERLESFCELLPPGVPAAFEFRHDSWFDDDVRACLASAGHALCVADTDEGGECEIADHGDVGYLRLRREDYSDDELRGWVDRLNGTNWKSAYVFFKHEDEAAGPLMARRFLELVG